LRLLEANSTVKPAQIVPQLLASWPAMPPRVKREILSRLVSKIQLHDWENGPAGGKRAITVHAVWE
jgi:hypothetical protein